MPSPIITVNLRDDYTKQYRAVVIPKQLDEIVVCSVSLWQGKIIDWSAYKGRGDITKQEDILHVAQYGDKIYEQDARNLFPDQEGRWRD